MKALIPAAGYGTRFLPASKTVPKEMLPVGAKPAIQLIVEEALAAGADEVVIVTSPDKPSLKRHFDPDPVWHARCAKKPEIDAELTHLEEIGRRISWTYQTEQKGLGHAVLQAADILRGTSEPVLILLGDALVSGTAPSPAMAAISRAFGGASVVGLEEVPLEKVSRYGVVKGDFVDAPAEAREGIVLKLSVPTGVRNVVLPRTRRKLPPRNISSGCVNGRKPFGPSIAFVASITVGIG